MATRVVATVWDAIANGRAFRVFNQGSPFAVPAGHSADLTEVVEFYRRKNRENDERIRNMTPEQIYAYGGNAPRVEQEEKKG